MLVSANYTINMAVSNEKSKLNHDKASSYGSAGSGSHSGEGATLKRQGGGGEFKRMKLLCFILFAVLWLLLLVVLSLITTEYARFVNAKCNRSNHSYPYYIKDQPVTSGGYDHVILICFIFFVASLKFVEFIQLGLGTWSFLSSAHKVSGKKLPCTCKYVGIIALLLIFPLLFAVAECYFAIVMDKEKLPCVGEDSSGGVLVGLFIAYCVLQLVCAVCGCVVRGAMLFHMFWIKEVWDKEQDTPIEGQCGMTASDLADAAYFAEYKLYRGKGEKVKVLMCPFTSWFLTPWIIFLFATLINSHTLLTPWTYRSEHSKVLLRARYFYMAYVLRQTLLLLVQNLCALQMNIYHKNYHCSMKKRLMEKRDDLMYKRTACQKTFEFEDQYDFRPTLFCMDPGIPPQAPLYILCLVFGIFITASDFMAKIR